MIDSFIVLTPVLLLVIVAIFGFVGCGFTHGSAAGAITLNPLNGLSLGGTQLTITGQGCDFVTISQVTFSDASGFSAIATNLGVPVNTATQGEQTLTCNTPPYAGTFSGGNALVTVQVDYIDGSGTSKSVSTSDPDGFTYLAPVTHVQTVAAGATGGKTITASALNLQGGGLIVATLQWSAAGNPVPSFSGASLLPVSGSPSVWNAMNVQSFYGMNTTSGQVSVGVNLSVNSTTPWSLCASAYDFVDPAAPVYGSVAGNPNYTGLNPQAPVISANPGDLVYAVVYAADPGGPFPGSNSLSAGSGFAAESGPINYAVSVIDPLVEDVQVMTASMVTAQATNTTANTNPRGFIIAMGIKAANG
jgi:hypothetical protein